MESSPPQTAPPPELIEKPPSRGRPRRASQWARNALFGALALWGITVLVCFIQSSSSLIGPVQPFTVSLLWAAASVYLFVFTGYRIRRWTLREPEIPGRGLETTAVEFALGTAFVIGVMIALGFAELYRPWVAQALLGLLTIGRHGAFWRSFAGRLRSASALSRSLPSHFLYALLLLAGVMTFLMSQAPATSQDALVYHLAIPQRYIDAGGIHYVPGNFFAQFPQNIEMLFTLGLLVHGESLAKFYHWMFSGAAAMAVGALAVMFHRSASALLAATLFATIPTVSLLAGWAYVDLGVVFFVTMSLMAFVRYWQDNRRRHLLLASLFAGVAAGCKYTAGLQGLAVAGGVLVLGGCRHWSPRTAAARALFVCLVVTAVAGVWWLKNIAYTGNPLFPFCYGIFGGAGWDESRAEVLALSLKQWGGERGLWQSFLLPWDVTMNAKFFDIESYDGNLGCAFLIGLPLIAAAMLRGTPARVAGAFMLVHALFWVVTTHQLRFLLPAVAVASALLAASVPLLRLSRGQQATLHWLLGGALAINVVMTALSFAYHRPVGVVLGLEDKHKYMQRELPGGDYHLFRYINERLKEDSRILFASLGNPGFLCKRSYHSDAFFENHTLKKILAESADPAEVRARFRDAGFTHLLFRWQNVFDHQEKTSDVPLADQMKLAAFLNRYAKQVRSQNGTFLYRVRWTGKNPPPEKT